MLVDKPDVKGREEILRIHAKGVKIAPDVDLKVIAARTAGFAGADLANLVNEAALLAARNDKTAVDAKDFESAIDRLVAGLEKKRVMSTQGAARSSRTTSRATRSSPPCCPASIRCTRSRSCSAGFGALGYTMQLPLEDRYLMTRSDLLSQLAVLLGGRTAEEIALGEISTGAQNDLQRATDIARAMVTEFGMSDALGAINYDGNKRARFLDIPMPQERGLYGEDTAQKIDAEIKRILTDAHDTARDILTDNRDKLERVTRRLLEIEVMEGDELRQLARRAARGASAGNGDDSPARVGVIPDNRQRRLDASTLRSTNLSTGTAAISAPSASSGRSSARLNRIHDFPISSFLPAFSNAAFKRARAEASTGMRYSDR